MVKPLFIAIGVHNAHSMQVLDGVLKGVDDLTSWANSYGYDVIKIDDRNQSVNINRIRNALTPGDPPSPALLLDRPRIVVYFCGHGLYAPQDQYWILSAGPNQSRERISIVGFRDTLATYGPSQIAIISDACRISQALTGQGDCVVDAYEADVGYPQKDIFFSSRDGAASFAVPAQAGKSAYCVFSETLLKALSEPDGDNLDSLYFQLGRKVVTSQSLADYLGNKVPQAALNVGKYQMPQCDAGFRPEKNDYVEFTKEVESKIKPGAINFGKLSPTGITKYQEKLGDKSIKHDFEWPGANSIYASKEYLPKIDATEFQKYTAKLSQKRQQERINQSRSEWRAPFVREVQNIINTFDNSLFIDDKYGPILVASEHCPLLIGLTTYESDNGRLMPPLFRERSMGYWFWDPIGFFQTRNSNVLIANSEDLYAPIPAYSDLWCALTFNHQPKQQDNYAAIGGGVGVDLLAWGGRYDIEISGELQAADALKGLTSGTLNSDDIKLFTQNMRINKHFNPMLGIVSAYLYNGIGDIDNIRRMCYYYYYHHQDVPFDIAMLANLPLDHAKTKNGFTINVPEVPALPEELRNPEAPNFTWERTPNVVVAVAGVTPIIRAGWQHIRHSKHKIHQQCWELIDHMTESPISTFSGDDAGKFLIQAFKEF